MKQWVCRATEHLSSWCDSPFWHLMISCCLLSEGSDAEQARSGRQKKQTNKKNSRCCSVWDLLADPDRPLQPSEPYQSVTANSAIEGCHSKQAGLHLTNNPFPSRYQLQ